MTSDQCLLGHAYVACFHPPRRDFQTGLLWVDQLAQKQVNVYDVQVGSLPLPRMLLFPPSSLLEDLHSRPVMTWPWAEVPVRSSKDLGVTNFAFVCRKCYLFVLFQKNVLNGKRQAWLQVTGEKSIFRLMWADYGTKHFLILWAWTNKEGNTWSYWVQAENWC